MKKNCAVLQNYIFLLSYPVYCQTPPQIYLASTGPVFTLYLKISESVWQQQQLPALCCNYGCGPCLSLVTWTVDLWSELSFRNTMTCHEIRRGKGRDWRGGREQKEMKTRDKITEKETSPRKRQETERQDFSLLRVRSPSPEEGKTWNNHSSSCNFHHPSIN